MPEDPEEIRIKRIINQCYLVDPCLGSLRLVTVLRLDQGVVVNRKRLRREIGHEAIWCKPRTSVPEIFKHRSRLPVHHCVVDRQAIGIEGEISMDRIGRRMDKVFIVRLWRSVKYEEIYLFEHITKTALLDFLEYRKVLPIKLYEPLKQNS